MQNDPIGIRHNTVCIAYLWGIKQQPPHDRRTVSCNINYTFPSLAVVSVFMANEFPWGQKDMLLWYGM